MKMRILEQNSPTATAIEGIAHATWAGADDGVDQLSIWRQEIAPGVATPPHRHDCDEIVLCLEGGGSIESDGAAHRFERGQLLVLPRGGLHRITNDGDRPLQLIGLFGSSPVATFLPDDAPLALPWRT